MTAEWVEVNRDFDCGLRMKICHRDTAGAEKELKVREKYPFSSHLTLCLRRLCGKFLEAEL
jgi:hypothetical protein